MPAAKIAERLLTPQFEIPDVIQQLAGEIRSLLNDTLIERQRLVGIGFALSAFVDAAQAVCVQSALLGWHQVPLAELLSRATGGSRYLLKTTPGHWRTGRKRLAICASWRAQW